MPAPTEKEKDLLDDTQLEKDTERFQELRKKPETERTDDEKKEFGELKQRYGKAMQKRVDELSWKAKTAEEKAVEADKRADEAERKTKELEEQLKKEKPTASLKPATIEYGEEKFFTDAALKEKMDKGDITEEEAIKHQQERMEAAAADKAYKRIKQEDQKKNIMETVKEDAEGVIAKYPYFKKDHPDFNPEDPLYKLTIELYQEGYAANPKGLSLAVKRAEQLLKVNKSSIDRTEDFNIEDNDAPIRRSGREKEITLSEAEKETALRMYGRGDIINPKSGRVYTENEALAKALQAKKARIGR